MRASLRITPELPAAAFCQTLTFVASIDIKTWQEPRGSISAIRRECRVACVIG